jgi:ArsR family transcriptional regulator
MTGYALESATTVARLFHALSDETRLEIVRLLHDGERCVCNLTDELGIAQSRLSFHLKTLKDAGIVTDRRAGRWVYYTLNETAFANLQDIVAMLVPEPQPTRPPTDCS